MFFHPVLRQLPVTPLERAMRKAVGFHPSHWSCNPYPPPLCYQLSLFIQNKVELVTTQNCLIFINSVNLFVHEIVSSKQQAKL